MKGLGTNDFDCGRNFSYRTIIDRKLKAQEGKKRIIGVGLSSL
jgi:hypothetical protein